jgi:ATP-dependent Clp protease protease subunit
MYNPYVIEQHERGERAYESTRAAQGPHHLPRTRSTTWSPNLIIAQLLFLESEDRTRTSTFTSTAPAASSSPAWRSGHDALHQAGRGDDVRRPGGLDGRRAAGGRRQGQTLRAAARPRHVHQPAGGFQGQASDIDIHAREILKIRAELNQILVEATGQDLARIEKDTDRDFFLRADEAKEYGIIDTVITNKSDIPVPGKNNHKE